MRISIDRLFRAHVGLILLLLLAYAVFKYLYVVHGHDHVFGIAPLFDLADETAVPTFVAATGLIAAGAVAALIAIQQRHAGIALYRSWWLVAGCLVFMAIDEGAGVHDRFSSGWQRGLGTGGIFYYAWVPVYLVLTAAVGGLLIPLARALPWRTSLRLIGAGALFVGAAIGPEMIQSSLLYEATGGRGFSDADFELIDRDPVNIAAIGIEEAGEMLAVALAIRALLLHLTADLGVAAIGLTAATARRREPAPKKIGLVDPAPSVTPGV